MGRPEDQQDHAAQVMEAELTREEIHREMCGLAPVLAMFCSLLLLPSYRDKHGCIAASIAAVAGSMLFSRWVLGRTDVPRYAELNGVVHHSARSFVHLVWLLYHNSDVFTRFIMLFIAPVDAARLSRQGSFKVYMAVHLVLTFYRFRGDPLETAAPWVVAIVVQSHMVFEISALKRRSEEKGFELYKVQRASCSLAMDAVRNVVNCFCDASAELSADLALVDDSPTLSTLLARQATRGKAFEHFIHMADRDEYRKFTSELTPQMVQTRADDPKATNPTTRKRRMQVRSMVLHLMDSYSVPLKANVFHAYIEDPKGEPVLIVGISEAWKPLAKSTGRPRSTSRGRSASIGQVNISTGRLQPTNPLYPKGDEHLLTTEPVASGASTAADGPRKRRGDSPRPAAARAMTSPAPAPAGWAMRARAPAGQRASVDAGGASAAADAARALTQALAALTPRGRAPSSTPPGAQTGPVD